MRVSVCMATYNGDLFLNQQLDSILKQLSLEDEIIISDNGSTDNTVSIIENYKDTRIKLLHFTEKNLILNFENALNKASGDVIFLSDQDDIWIEGKVQKYKELLKDNLLVFSNASIFQNNNIESSKLFFNSQRKRTGIFNNLIKVNFLGCTLAFQRRVLEKALPFPKNIPMHDIWIGLIAETMGNTFYIEKPLIFYRRHENVASATGSKSSFSLAKKIKIRIDLLVGLIFRSFK